MVKVLAPMSRKTSWTSRIPGNTTLLARIERMILVVCVSGGLVCVGGGGVGGVALVRAALVRVETASEQIL